MNGQELQEFLTTFFNETKCEIMERTSSSISVQLTIDVDKRIMNRPFYWQYVEATGAEANPSQLHLLTKRDEKTQFGKFIHFGSPLLNRIFQATKDLGFIVKMYENSTSGPLAPWLAINYKVSYQCHRTKEAIYSFGINLLNGAIVTDFHDFVCARPLTKECAVYCIPPIINIRRAIQTLDDKIQSIIAKDDHSWAQEAINRCQKEIDVLNYFFNEKNERYEMEKKAIEERYKPRIKVEIINGGIFYINNNIM